MNLLRSIIFYILLALWTLIIGFVGAPTMLTGQYKYVILVVITWSRGSVLLMRWICRLHYQVTGLQNIPREGNFIVACKQQSAWETIFLYKIIPNPVFVLKKELLYIPIYGWYILLLRMIAVKRQDTIRSMKEVINSVQQRYEEGKNVIIFPEGTRTSQQVALKPGIYAMHKKIPSTKVLPIALDSGKYWGGRGSWTIKPGVVKLNVHQAMSFNTDKTQYLTELGSRINSEL